MADRRARIIPFEFARTPERTRRILKRCGEDGQRVARCSLYHDFVIPAPYALATKSAADPPLADQRVDRIAIRPPTILAISCSPEW